MNIIIAILALSIIIIIHELGHFWAARRCGVLVEEFSIGMGPRLIKIKRGETLYSFKLFPIGGACRMRGEDSEPENNSTETSQKVIDDRSFCSKPLWKRFIIIMAGIVMNAVLAFVIILITYTVNDLPGIVITELTPGYPAEAAGFLPGDYINRINGKKILLLDDVYSAINKTRGSAEIEIVRQGEVFTLAVNPAADKKIGIGYGYTNEPIDESGPYVRAGIIDTARISLGVCGYYVKTIYEGVGNILTRKTNVKELSGPIGIVNFIGDTYEQGMDKSPWVALWNVLSLVAMLSINLAVCNFLPIPALDGGRIIFLLIEAVRGKPISPEKEGIIHFAGFVLLMIFAVFVAYNDILKLI